MMETQKKYPMDTWAPVIDNEIIPSDPATILNDRALNDRAQQREWLHCWIKLYLFILA